MRPLGECLGVNVIGPVKLDRDLALARCMELGVYCGHSSHPMLGFGGAFTVRPSEIRALAWGRKKLVEALWFVLPEGSRAGRNGGSSVLLGLSPSR